TIDCPICHTHFPSPATLVGHLNSGQGNCTLSNVDSDLVPFPLLPGLYWHHDDPIISGLYHASSGFIYGRGETLLDKLKVDKNERHWEHAMY
ncbi:hypothetical protein PAXRUDRAFT_176129, partial [Paxillus rubicundulus Ve08.2h10]